MEYVLLGWEGVCFRTSIKASSIWRWGLAFGMQFKYVSKSLLLQTQRPAGQNEGRETGDREEDRRRKEEEILFCYVRAEKIYLRP